MVSNGYFIIDAADPNLDTILKAINTQYTDRGASFLPSFNADRTQVLVQLKRDFDFTLLNSYLQLGEASVSKLVVEDLSWKDSPLPSEVHIKDYLSGSGTVDDLLTTITDETMAAGSAVLDFGIGTSNGSIDVTGQSGLSTRSVVQAAVMSQDSTDHSADEHTVETLAVFVGNIIAGVGFTIYGTNKSQLGNTLLTGTFNVSWIWR